MDRKSKIWQIVLLALLLAAIVAVLLMNSRLNASEKRLADAQGQLAESEASAQALQKDLDDTKADRDAALDKLEAAEAAADESGARVAELEGQLAEAKSEADAAAQRVKELEEGAAAAPDAVGDSSKAENADTRDDGTEAGTPDVTANDAKSGVLISEALYARYDALVNPDGAEMDDDARIAALDAMEAGALESASKLGEAEQKLETANQKLDESEKQLQAANSRADEAEQKLETANGKLEEVEQKLETANGKLDETEQKLEALSGKLEEAEQKLETANGKLDDTEQKLEAANKKLDETEGKLAAADDKAAELQDRLDAAEQRGAELSEALDEKQQTIDSQGEKIDALTAQTEADAETKADLQGQLDEARSDATAKGEELDARKVEYEKQLAASDAYRVERDPSDGQAHTATSVQEAIEVEADGVTAAWRYDNAAISAQPVVLSLQLDGETIYTSDTLKPGEGIEQITLEKPLAPGSYQAVAVTTIYNKKGEVEFANRVPVTLNVAG